jgi:peptidoglycan/LPS O-acetylase OafA/YrhL
VLRIRTDLSYGVYLYGAPVLVALLLADVTHRWWLLAPAAFVVVLPLAAASWFLVERPALRWSRVISAPGVGSGRIARRVLRAADPLTRGEAAPIGD